MQPGTYGQDHKDHKQKDMSEMFPVDMADKPARDQERMTTDNTVRIQDHLDLKIMAGMDTAAINRQYGS